MNHHLRNEHACGTSTAPRAGWALDGRTPTHAPDRGPTVVWDPGAHDHEQHVAFVGTAGEASAEMSVQELVLAAQARERAAADRLGELDRSKSEFVATVNHELRTPLTNIAGYLEILEDTCDESSADQAHLLEAMRRNCDRLSHLVENLLTLSGLDSDGAPEGVAEVDLAKIVRDTSQHVHHPSAGDKRLNLTLDTPSEPVVVHGNEDRLRRVVLNLVSNAVKFANAGGSITCVLRTGEGQALLSVSDDGIGVPQSEQSGLFTPFFRSSEAQARQIPGVGLGLAIAASIVEAHHGTIAAQSERGRGTTLTVRLPLKPVGYRRTLLQSLAQPSDVGDALVATTR